MTTGALWYPALLKSGEYHTAHILKEFPDGIRPACGARPLGLGICHTTAADADCLACGQCARILKKSQSTLKRKIA
jgi:hypothetical protein